MQLIHQIMDQQIIPEQATQKHQDVFARHSLERGNIPVRICPFDDARIIPGCQLSCAQMIRYNDFLNGLEERRSFTPDIGGIGVIRYTRPILFVA